MSRRSQEPRKNLTAAETELRRKQEGSAFELGVPLCPDQYASNDRALWAAWKRLAQKILAVRKLAFSDGEALLSLAKATKLGQKDLAQKIYDETWGSRPPFPEPPKPALTLERFLVLVRKQRDTFADRLNPENTVCLDGDGTPYSWKTGDPAEIARRYAQEVSAGTIVAGELIRRAAYRFLNDLDTGASRGLYFDPVAARHICRFSEGFCDIKLMSWQVFVLVNIFAWKKPSGARRFTEAWISCAKKSGKTRLASCVALWGLIADGEKYPDVFSAATKKEQSKLVWRDAKRCVQDNPELAAHVQRWAGALAVKDTDGSFTPLSSDEKSMDGLRPSVIIADEVAFWGDRDQWDKLVKGVVSRVQPLTFAVTTAGSTKQCFAFGKFDLGEKILRGIYNDDSTFVAIFAIDKEDDPMDEACWLKGNPSLGVTIHTEHLRKTRDEVTQDPSGLNAWLQYHCNIWPDATLNRMGSIPVAKWEACDHRALLGENLTPIEATVRFLELNKETPFYVGLDIGLSSDLTAICSLFPHARFAEDKEPLQKKVAIITFYMPEQGLLDKEKAWRVPLSVWAREGWISLFPGDMADTRIVKRDLISMYERFYVRDMGYDPWQAQVMAAELNESGKPCTAVPQTAKELTAPCRELISAISNQEIVHFGNPVLSWMAGNVILAEDAKHGGTKPDKLSYGEKIDGISALVNAWHRMLAVPPSVYEFRGIQFI